MKQGSLLPVYLFHGEEEYVKEQALDGLKHKLIPQFEELNLSIFDTGSADDIIAACDIAPFMADKRMTVCRFIPKDKDAKKLTEYMQSMPADTVLIFCIHGKADAKSAIVKAVKSMGGEVLFDYLTEDDAAKWVMQNALKSGCTINAADARYMVELVGHDMLSIKNELSKLCDYAGQGGVITKKSISDIVIKNLEFQLYNTYGYFTNGKMQDGFRSLESITNGKDKDQESFGIAGYFLSCLKAALCAHDMLAKGAGDAAVSAATGRKGYALRELCRIARKYTRERILTGIELFANVARTKIVLGMSSYNALCDAIIKTFGDSVADKKLI